MKAHIRYYLIIIFLITFPKVAFGNNQIKIGLLAPFTGEFENIGKSIINHLIRAALTHKLKNPKYLGLFLEILILKDHIKMTHSNLCSSHL